MSRSALRHLVACAAYALSTIWVWLDDQGNPTTEQYPVTIVVLNEGGGAYLARAYRTDEKPQMIADEWFKGRGALARARRWCRSWRAVTA